MQVFFVLWLIVAGVDHGPPPIAMDSLDQCKELAHEYVQKGPPDGVDLMRVGCVQEMKPGNPA